MADLTAKQRAFVQEYLVDLNATQAALRAGFSVKTAHVQSAQLMAKPGVKAAVDAAQFASLHHALQRLVDGVAVAELREVRRHPDVAGACGID